MQLLSALLTLLPLASALPATASPSTSPIPLIIWHGLGDTYDAPGLLSTGALAARTNPGTYIHNIRISNQSSSDRRATFFGNLTDQLSQVCEDLRTHPVLSRAPAVNALGFSQGGQFLRAYVERCNDPPVRNLVTFGSQHNGISRFQTCASTDFLCRAAQGLLNANTWSEVVQGSLVPAQYFRDPRDLEAYLNASNFLADINNEREVRNETYAARIVGLNRFVVFVFEKDKTVVPKESGWFSEVNETSREVTGLRDRVMFKEDWLGLRALDEKGGLVFRTAGGAHMELTDKVLVDVYKNYFSPEEEEGEESGGLVVKEKWWEFTGQAQKVALQIKDAWADL